MDSGRATGSPLICRWLLRLAARLLPGEQRAQWLSDREREYAGFRVLFDRGELAGATLVDLLRHWFKSLCAGITWHGRALRILGGPWLCLATIIIVIAFAGFWTKGFSGLRSVVASPTQHERENLFTATQKWRMGWPHTVERRLLRIWEAESRTVAGFATFSFTQVRLADGRKAWTARVSPNYFFVLGAQPAAGRVFTAGDREGVVLSDALWREIFSADPRIIGRKMIVDGTPMTVAGVMPPEFWFQSRGVKLWTVSPVPPEPYGAPAFGVVLRVRPQYNVLQAQAELRTLTVKNHRPWAGSIVELDAPADALAPLDASRMALLIGAAVILYTLAAQFAGRRTRRCAWRYWSFFLVKCGLALLALALAWIECATARTAPVPGTGDALFDFLFSWSFLLLPFGVFSLALRDQRRRCPVCLQRLTMPVRLGSWSSPLLDPVTTELLCERGHGALYLPETQSSDREPERWTDLDESWKDLFTSGR